MHPVLFGPVKSFGFLLAVSFAVGIWFAVRRGRRAGVAVETIYDLSFVILVSSLIGVRAAYVVTHLSQFAGHPWRVFAFNEGGLTLYGGLVLAIAASWVFCRRRRLPFLRAADLMLPSVALGIGITRIGCYLGGCCFGQPCDLPWAVHFPSGAPATDLFGSAGVHPAQLYSSAGGFLIFGLLLWWERRSARLGETLGRFLLLYGLQRFLVDFVRYYEPSQRLLFGWSNNQWFSLGFAAVGVLVIARAARRR
ncbi:MAG TPA: prolipoprotein diacylglyceryl transferase [Candidatus Krumholzibacteria bacterium]|nr:prolipoprotein diacylglyceryl transferase [Candidatus Krumholzibacteria bacterium]HPD71362.1 prolipoprotein diacylglyceryl transferase [Candidatus Krumholzibacteria bacterium]HRY38938.1 prolipoprotein diacylglyceryl transferase [Candidatus Krumholzibacteria bacterium]